MFAEMQPVRIPSKKARKSRGRRIGNSGNGNNVHDLLDLKPKRNGHDRDKQREMYLTRNRQQRREMRTAKSHFATIDLAELQHDRSKWRVLVATIAARLEREPDRTAAEIYFELSPDD